VQTCALPIYFRCQSAPDYRGGVLPPQYDEAGYPFRDMGVHALYLLEAFLGPIRDVTGQFAASDGDQSYSEWRALVRAERGSGQIHLSWNVKPAQSLLLIHGTRGIVRVDLHGMTVTTRRVLPLPEMLHRPTPAAALVREWRARAGARAPADPRADARRARRGRRRRPRRSKGRRPRGGGHLARLSRRSRHAGQRR